MVSRLVALVDLRSSLLLPALPAYPSSDPPPYSLSLSLLPLTATAPHSSTSPSSNSSSGATVVRVVCTRRGFLNLTGASESATGEEEE
jgi:hypothetical protein